MSIEKLILDGVVEFAGVDSETGQFLYNFTNKFYEYFPDAMNDKLDMIKAEMKFFWEAGFIDVDDIDSVNPMIALTDKSFDEVELSKLPKEKQLILEELKKFFEER